MTVIAVSLLKRARVSLTLRLICGYLLRSLLPFLTFIYETLLDLEIYKMRVSICCDHTLSTVAVSSTHVEVERLVGSSVQVLTVALPIIGNE